MSPELPILNRPSAELATHRGRADAICLDAVSYRYASAPWAQPVLRDVTLHVPAGTRLGIIGPNGAGKTTLLKIILGELTGYTGSVQVLGMAPRRACLSGRAIGYVPQRHEAQGRFPLSVRQAVLLGLTAVTPRWRGYAREDVAYGMHLIERVGMADLSHRAVGDLSGGQQQRVFLARALVTRPKILVLDEPAIGLDASAQQRFAELMTKVHAELGLTVLMVSHDLRAIAAGCDRVACLNQRLHYHDAPQGLTRDVLAEVFEHEVIGLTGVP